MFSAVLCSAAVHSHKHTHMSSSCMCTTASYTCTRASCSHPIKVIVRPYFTRTVPNFDGVSWENYEVSQDAEPSRFCPTLSVIQHHSVDKVYTYKPNIEFVVISCVLSNSEALHPYAPPLDAFVVLISAPSVPHTVS